MTPLRQRMIDEMTLRGMSPRTHESYIGAVYGLARHYKRSPDQLVGACSSKFDLLALPSKLPDV